MEAPTIKREEEITIKEEPDDNPDSSPNERQLAPVRVKEEDVEIYSPPVKRKSITPVKINEVEESNEEQHIEISPSFACRTDYSSSEKSKALSRDETRGLLNLILMHPILTSRETNATFNYQKVIEWNQITEDFNSTYSLYPRTPKQLRLKWENMKKNARRRNAKIRANKKTEIPELIARDDILDQVYTLLRRRPSDKAKASHDEDSDDSDEDLPLAREEAKVLLNQESNGPEPQTSFKPNVSHNNTNGFSEQPRKKKKKDEGCAARNRAMAVYYEAKTKLIDASLINIKLQNEKLRLEIEILKRNKRK